MDTKKERYFDRELSWIEFNARVLMEGMDVSNPLLERLKFVGIVSSNFDEFFMVRVASLQGREADFPGKVYQRSFFLMEQCDRYFAETLAPELERQGIVRVPVAVLSEEQKNFIENFFNHELLPLLTPIAIRNERPLPDLVNLSLYRIVQLATGPGNGAKFYSVIEIPHHCPRMIVLPSEDRYVFILLEDVISIFAGDLFPGYQVVEQGLLRVTRAAEMTLDEEKDEDFARVLTEALSRRRRSSVVRMEISATEEIVDFFREKLAVHEEQIYRHPGWLDLKSISRLAFQPGFEKLKLPAWAPGLLPDFQITDDFWDLLKQKDVWVHYPYESFDAFVRFLSKAAVDPDVLAIKQTLYRVAKGSVVTAALERAVENGKQVTVLIEVKARFDEERNIEWATRLANTGATVLYGVAGLKTHAKACLVIRREVEGVKRYLYLGTGNFNERTAQVYSDIGFFTSNEELAQDVSSFFNVITGFSNPTGFLKIDISPYGLRRKLERLIGRETMRSQKERPGLIMAKMNSLVDTGIIDALYRASQAGVRILLNIRGVCCLKPGIKGLSENIEVVSIVDMFLEHSRIFYFYNGGDEEIYLSSADWMQRNLDRRLEILFPVENREIRKELIELLKLYFKDNAKAWQLLPDGRYLKKDAAGGKKFRVQEHLCQKAVEKAAGLARGPRGDIKPQKPKPDTGNFGLTQESLRNDAKLSGRV